MADSPHAKRLGGLVGYKLGWKDKYSEQRALYGPIFGCGIINEGESVSLTQHKVFCAEAEFGFTFGVSLPARVQPYSEEEVWAAVDDVSLCIELCGTRQSESTDLLHYVADALSGASIIVGPSIATEELDPAGFPHVGVEIILDGEVLSRGDATSNPFDSPLASVTFLVNELCVRHGVTIQGGSLVIAGHCCQAGFKGRPAPPHVANDVKSGKLPAGLVKDAGSVIRADFAGIGNVTAGLLP